MATIKFTDLSQNYDPVQSGVIPFVDISGGNTHYKVSQYDLTKKPCFLAVGIAQTVTGNSTVTKINAGTESYDSHNFYNPSLQRFTPLKSGYYYLYTNVQLNSVPQGTLVTTEIQDWEASVVARGILTYPTGKSINIMVNTSAITYAKATGEYFSPYIYQDSTSNLSTAGATTIFMGYGI